LAKRPGRLRRILARLAVAAAVLAVAGLAAFYWQVRRSWPWVEGRLEVPGLQARVEVIRDGAGVPHIYAANDHDLLFAQGYVHAQDRLWSMDFDRRLASGTLSEVIGAQTARLDLYLRTLGSRHLAEGDLRVLAPETRALLAAYCEGINAFIADRRGRYPIEYTLFRSSPAPWTPVDVLVRAKLMAWLLSQNQQFELSRARMIARLGPAKVQELLPPYRDGAALVIPPEAGGYPWLRKAELHDDLGALFGGTTFNWGSNAWSVSGARTATGKPLLANDTHLEMAMPSVWYHNGLHGGSFDIVGASLPGVPLVILGTNGRIAWGVTDMLPDVQDFYIEKLDDPKHPRRYMSRGAWRDLAVETGTIRVRGSAPVPYEIYRTEHGPIMNGVIGRLKGYPEKLALRWSETEPSHLLDAIARVDRAVDWGSFHAALSSWDGPHMNFVYADAQGNVGYQASGRVPVRAAGDQGLLPMPGWTGEHEWQRFIPFEELPRMLNPKSGAVISANNKIVGDDYPYHLAYEWSDPYRAMRIADLLAGRDHLTAGDFATMQLDTYSLQAQAVVPVLLAVAPGNDLERRAHDLVARWDLRNDARSPGAAVYQVFYRFFLRDTVGDELGKELATEYQVYEWIHGPFVAELVKRPRDPWFDDVTTPGVVETEPEIARRSFREAVAWLAEHCGGDPAAWSWGAIHPSLFSHRPLGRSGIAPLERLFNGPVVPAPGDRYTINAAWFANDESRPFAANGGAGQRLIVDLADPDNSRFVQNSGQVEQLFHPHRLDLVPAWQSGEYRPLLFTRKAVAAHRAATLILDPHR